MKDFFNVKTLDEVYALIDQFGAVAIEQVALDQTWDRVLAQDIVPDCDLPEFPRATMDGYAVNAADTFGASEGNPAFFTVKGAVSMGEQPAISVNAGEAVRIPTGGFLPRGTNAVVMVEHTQELDPVTIEVYKSVAPGANMIQPGEDAVKGEVLVEKGQRIRPQDTGLLAALGRTRVQVYRRPVIGIISTGDEIVPVDQSPQPGQIRDINTHSLSALVREAGAIPVSHGIIQDDYDQLFAACEKALAQSDMVLISGGSSVGTRDYTIDAISSLADSRMLFHGISISPGKPTLLARVGQKPFWGLPGHVVSAMVVCSVVVRPFLDRISGLRPDQYFKPVTVPAVLTRNLVSAQGRTDYVRVRLRQERGTLWAEPVLGKSGLIRTMVKAHGLIRIDMNTEGLYKDTDVDVMLF